MMTEPEIVLTGLSMEAIPSGRSMPEWLVKSLLEGRRLMIIHPSEESRKQAIENLYSMGGKSIDTTHHLTIKRLIGILHLDLRLPVLLEDDGVLFEKTHIALAQAAANFEFPLLLTNPQHRWSRSRSRRLLSLYKELVTLRRPWSWEEDPGAKSCDKVLKSLETEMQATHPYRLERVVWNALRDSDETPFTISDVEGIIMLDHASGIGEVSIEILKELSRYTGIHQLVNPGSHRLGFHGEYIEDIAPIRKNSLLPEWVPRHDVWAAEASPNWSSIIGESRERSIHHVMCDLFDHSHLALANILQEIEGDVVVVSGDADALKEKLQPHLANSGRILKTPSCKVKDTAPVARILSFADISRGEEAWSLSKLNDLWAQIELPMSWSILDLEHPSMEDWKPRLHPGVLTELARGFHLLGGRGALRRWLATMENASPRAGVDPERRERELEECQWWLACIANWMHPIISSNDQEALSTPIVGCSSNQTLPLPSPPSDVISWLNSCLEQIDWDIFTSRDDVSGTSFPGLQHLMVSISKLQKEKIELTADNFSEVLTILADSVEIPSIRSSDKGIQILSPSQAYGLETENLILCGIDAETWSMRPPQVPWLDDSNRISIGLHQPDLPLRQARHHLRHFLNCAQNILIIDSSLEEGVELAGPLDEWFSDITQEGGLESLSRPPPYLDSSLWHPETSNRSWECRTIRGQTKLVYCVNSMEISSSGVRTHRSGQLPRDSIQRNGISTLEARNPDNEPLNSKSLLAAAEIEILTDQLSRRRTGEELELNQIFPFSEANSMVLTSDLKLLPTKSKPANGRQSEVWPHLGIMGKKGLGVPIDPRPISPPATGILDLDSITGRASSDLQLPRVWSQGRLQAWLECPRRAWFERHMYIGRSDSLREDLSANVRGDIVHQVEEAVLRGHGLNSESSIAPLPLQEGNLDGIEGAWEIALQVLVENATWMRREDGISAHRCRDLIGVSPREWRDWLESGTPIPIGGRIGRMIQCDFDLSDVAPIASEWQLNSDEGMHVSLGIPESETQLLLRGRIDRVDQLLVDGASETDEIVPLDIELGKSLNYNRLIIIRDIKSVDGSKDNGNNERHLKGIFHELQLALYARAWEIAHPGDRVIGVGATQVGIDTHPFLEIDPEFIEQCSEMNVGIVDGFTHDHYRLPGDSIDTNSNPFRAWMRERITTALRVIENASSGNIHPEPSNSCKYCSIIDSCPSAKRGDW